MLDVAPDTVPAALRLLIVAENCASAARYQGFSRLVGRHDVTIVEDAAEALSLMSVRSFDVVLADLAAPKIGADGLVRAIRTGGDDRTAIILVGGAAGDFRAERALRAGADDHAPGLMGPSDFVNRPRLAAARRAVCQPALDARDNIDAAAQAR